MGVRLYCDYVTSRPLSGKEGSACVFVYKRAKSMCKETFFILVRYMNVIAPF